MIVNKKFVNLTIKTTAKKKGGLWGERGMRGEPRKKKFFFVVLFVKDLNNPTPSVAVSFSSHCLKTQKKTIAGDGVWERNFVGGFFDFNFF